MHSLKNVFMFSYENRIQCKIKCKSKQTNAQKDSYVFILFFQKIFQRFCKHRIKRKDCCAKIYFCNVYKKVCWLVMSTKILL